MMTLDEAKPKLEYLACMLFSDNRENDADNILEMRRIVHALMNSSIYEDEFLDITDEKIAERLQFMAAVRAVCKKLGIVYPDNVENALLSAAKRTTCDIINGIIAPRDGLYTMLFELYYGFNADNCKLLEDWHSFYYRFDIRDDSGKEKTFLDFYTEDPVKIDEEIVALAKEWREEYAELLVLSPIASL